MITVSEAMQDEDWLSCVKDLLDLQEIQQMKMYKHHRNITCFEHCVKVSYACYSYCLRHKKNYKSAARIGLLHDLFLYQREQLPRRLQRFTHLFTHGKCAVRNASKLVYLTKVEQKAIARHMFPLTLIPAMSQVGLLLSYYDKIYGFRELFLRE